MWRPFAMKTINHWRKNSKKTIEDKNISNAHGLAESILWKWLYYQKQSLDSIKSLQIFNDINQRD
jgi:hypothetical protein